MLVYCKRGTCTLLCLPCTYIFISYTQTVFNCFMIFEFYSFFRPLFTYWLILIQTLIFIITVSVHGFAPVGYVPFTETELVSYIPLYHMIQHYLQLLLVHETLCYKLLLFFCKNNSNLYMYIHVSVLSSHNRS